MSARAVRSVFLGGGLVLASCAAMAQQAPTPETVDPATSPALTDKPPGAFKADPGTPTEDPKDDVWIFSGTLQSTHENYSGTLVAGTKGQGQFELKLDNGATCEGGDLKGDVGLVRLPEIACSDGRIMRALFVPQSGQELKVFGHVGEDRFAASAHLLGTEAPPPPKQTAQPKGPLGLPPKNDMPNANPPSGAPPSATEPPR